MKSSSVFFRLWLVVAADVTFAIPVVIFYSMVILSASFRSCRVGHLSSTSITLMLGVFLCQVKVNLAVPHCTFCQCPFFMWIPQPTSIFEDGMHKGQVNSLILLAPVLRVHCKNPSVLLALLHMLSVCVPYPASFWIMTAQALGGVIVSNWCPWRVYVWGMILFMVTLCV